MTLTTTKPVERTAVVIGASMAGLMTARILSDHFERVTILERDALAADAITRRGVPQGRHAHVFVRVLVAARRSPVSRRESHAGPGKTPDHKHLDAHAAQVAVTHVARQWSLR